MNCIQTAIDSLSHKISVWPPRQDGTKAPDGAWKSGQSALPTEQQVLAWYADGRTGVGWITGAVSGGLEVLDFDDRSTWAEFCKLCGEAGLGGLLDKVAGGYLENTPNGAHLAYRCELIEGNQKIAQRADKKALIETRGEGGFVIVAPSHGAVNLKGAYVLVSGGVATIATITPAERRVLFDVARIFDELPIIEHAPPRQVGDGDRPGDAYNASASWDDVLAPHGWRRVSGRLGTESWCRPGKDFGISATTNHAGSDLLYVFSTSTAFESGRGYSKFSAYALLTHGGDFSAASKELRLLGYGVDAPEEPVDLSGIMARIDNKQSAPELDLRVPGLLGELAAWINETSHRQQPVLALGAAISALATALGRKVRTETDLRTNLYVLGVGETGCGKERAREAIKQLFLEIGMSKAVGESFASDSAVERSVILNPACLYLIDEMGIFLGTVKDESTPAYVKNIVSVFLRLYSSSASLYKRKFYASDDPKSKEANEVEQPCLSLYGTTVPGSLYGALTKEQLSNGFISRLLVFESTDPDPELKWIDAAHKKIPQALVDGFSFWAKAPNNADTGGNLEQLRPSPLIVKTTTEARDVYMDLEQTMRRLREAERNDGRDHGPYTRVVATAQKLALVRACGIRTTEPEITGDDARWGASTAWALMSKFLEKIHGRVAENKTESHSIRVLEIIKRKPITKSQLTSKTQWLKRADRNDILGSLIEAGQVLANEEKIGKTTRTTYKALS